LFVSACDWSSDVCSSDLGARTRVNWHRRNGELRAHAELQKHAGKEDAAGASEEVEYVHADFFKCKTAATHSAAPAAAQR
jgi:hypothetical protein